MSTATSDASLVIRSVDRERLDALNLQGDEYTFAESMIILAIKVNEEILVQEQDIKDGGMVNCAVIKAIKDSSPSFIRTLCCAICKVSSQRCREIVFDLQNKCVHLKPRTLSIISYILLS